MIKHYKFLNNYLDILSYSNDLEFKQIINNLDDEYMLEHFIFNLDNYITYIKSLIHVNSNKLKYIISNTLYNKYNKILYSNLYYDDNINYYIKEFNKMFICQYKINFKLLSKYKNLEKYNFNELIELLNNNKRAYIYFEKITKQNILYYSNLINSIDL